MKGSIQQENIAILNIYAPNIGSTQIYKANIIRSKDRDQLQYNNNWTLTPHSQYYTDHLGRKSTKKH